MVLFTRFFLFLSLGFILFQACGVDAFSVKGNGNIISKEIKIDDYENIDLSIPCDVIYQHHTWESPYLQINVDENLMDLIEIRTENGSLIIKNKDNSNLNPSRCKIYTNSTLLKNIRIAGSGEVHLQGEVNADKIKIDIAGSGTAASDSLYCNEIKVSIAGSGDARLGGVSNVAFFDISGSGKIIGFDYQVKQLTCQVSGSGNIDAYIHESIEATINGSGSIRYKGNPEQIKENISGSGKISKVN